MNYPGSTVIGYQGFFGNPHVKGRAASWRPFDATVHEEVLLRSRLRTLTLYLLTPDPRMDAMQLPKTGPRSHSTAAPWPHFLGSGVQMGGVCFAAHCTAPKAALSPLNAGLEEWVQALVPLDLPYAPDRHRKIGKNGDSLLPTNLSWGTGARTGDRSQERGSQEAHVGVLAFKLHLCTVFVPVSPIPHLCGLLLTSLFLQSLGGLGPTALLLVPAGWSCQVWEQEILLEGVNSGR